MARAGAGEGGSGAAEEGQVTYEEMVRELAAKDQEIEELRNALDFLDEERAMEARAEALAWLKKANGRLSAAISAERRALESLRAAVELVQRAKDPK